LTLAFGAHSLHYNYATDDAFITFRYVRNMLAGHGLVYNLGERVEGYTNFLWAVLIALPTTLGANIQLSAQVLGFLFSAGTLVLVTIIARDYVTEKFSEGGGRMMALLPAALLAANGSFSMWALGGLETAFFTFLLVLAILVYLKAERSGLYACGILFALLVMTRPDGMVFLAATMAHVAFVSIRARGVENHERLKSNILRILAAFLVIYAPYFLWRYSYYGYLLPNTFYAKVGTGAAPLLRGLSYSLLFVETYGIVPVVVAVAYFYTRIQQPAADQGGKLGFTSLLLVLQIAAYTAFIIWVGGDQLVMYRFFVPLLPLIYLLTLRGVAEIFSRKDVRTGRRKTRSWPVYAAELSLFVAAVVLTALPSFVGREHYRVFNAEKPADADRKMVGEWLKQNAAPETTIALIPAGIIPFYSGLKTIDLVGLNDVRIAHTEVANFGKGEPGHEKHNSAYVLERRPDLIFLGSCRIWPEKLSADSLTNYYWIYGKLAPGNREMLALGDFKRNYSPYAARVDSGYVHFFKRNDFFMPNAEPIAVAPVASATPSAPARVSAAA